MKNFKKITSIMMAAFVLFSCVACSNFTNNDIRTHDEFVATDTSTIDIKQERVVVCSHSNGGDTTSRIIDDHHHENGIICFDCNEIVWSEIHENHDLSNLTGACVCGYECEHGNGDDFYYEVAEDTHTVFFVCNTCGSIIHEETNEHFIRDNACIHCGYNIENPDYDKNHWFCNCENYGNTIFQEFDDENHQVGLHCSTCNVTKWESFENHFYYEGVCQLSMCHHVCTHSETTNGKCDYCGLPN